jgi:hypothetical protein
MSKTKTICANVNIFFDVPADYEVTNDESIEFIGGVHLKGGDYQDNGERGILADTVRYHETIDVIEDV